MKWLESALNNPRAFELLGNSNLIGGLGTALESTLNYRVHGGRDSYRQLNDLTATPN